MKERIKVHDLLQNISPLRFSISVSTCYSKLLSALTWAN